MTNLQIVDKRTGEHPGIWVFHTRDFNQSKVVIIFKPEIINYIVVVSY
jgi:hypothetical protein